MTQILKQSTQIDVRVGPFVAVGDGFTPVLTAEVSKMDEAELLLANGAATRAFGQADTGLDFMSVTGADGWADCRLSTTDTNTVGTLDIVFQDDSLFLPVHKSFQVVEGLVYDRMYATDATGADTGSIAVAVWGATSRAITSAAANAFDTGVYTGTAALANDTGAFVNSIWGATSRIATSVSGAVDSVTNNVGGNVTGSVGSVTVVSPNAVDTGSFTGTAAKANDTGVSVNAIWAATDRQLTGFLLDTGVADTVWKASTSTYTADTGSVAYAQGRLMAVRNDTGAAHLDAGRLGVTATSSLDTGATKDAVWGTAPGTSDRYLTGSANVDTGVADTVWKSSQSTYTDTGSLGYGVNVSYLRTDTGAADRLLKLAGSQLSINGTLDSGSFASGFLLDTGDVKDTVWQTVAGTDGAGALGTTLDTGLSDAVWKYSTSGATGDTGSVGYAQGRLMAVKGDTGAAHLDAGRLGTSATATLDTGGTKDAVWGTAPGVDGAGTLGTVLDTGLADAFWKYSTSLATGDTGSVGYAQGRLMAVKGDTGAAHLDAGRLGVTATSSLDTGATKDAVWGTVPGTSTRYLTGSENIDTGVANQVWKESHSTYTDTGSFGYGINVAQVFNDTGAAAHLAQMADEYDTGRLPAEASATLDTGAVHDAVWNVTPGDSTKALNSSLNIDTGIADTVWKSSHSTYTDTGSLGYGVNVSYLRTDTGAADRWFKFAGVKLSDSGTLDTGSGTPGGAAAALDTGAVHDAVWNVTAGDDTKALTTFAFDTGIAQTVWRESTSAYTGDTGSVAYAQGRLMAAHADTGAVHLVSGRLAATDSGIVAAVLDTGKVAAAVWTSHATRVATSVSGAVGSVTTVSANAVDTGSFTGTAALANDTGALVNKIWGATDRQLTAFALDTGVANTVWKESSSTYTGDTGSVGYAQGRLMAVKGDTGAAHLDAGRLGVSATASLDTGATKDAVWGTAPGTSDRYLTGSANVDTGVANAVWKESQSTYTDTGSLGYGVNTQYVNRTLVAGTGDTGISDEWRPA